MPSEFHRSIGATQQVTPKDVAERVVARAAGEIAHRETLAKFGGFTAENCGAALAWQETRMRELLAQPRMAKIMIAGQSVIVFDAATNADLGSVPVLPRKPRGQERPTLRATLETFCASIGYTLDAPQLR